MKARLRRRDVGRPRRLEERMEVAKLVVQVAAEAAMRATAMWHRAKVHRRASLSACTRRAAGMTATGRCHQQDDDKEETIRHRLLASA